jgi:NADPH:quinone reductase-like Zn-dependent oxidoreductase/acyl carrier protein
LEHLTSLSSGQRVLIHAAAGGVGLAAVQLAQRAGAEVFATAGSDAKRDYLRSLGVSHVLNSRSTAGFTEYIANATNGHGIDVALNALSGAFIPATMAVMAQGGTFLEIGKSGIWTEQQVRSLDKDLRYFIVDWSENIERDAALIGSILRRIVDDVEGGVLKPLRSTVFPFLRAAEAFRYMAQGRQIGRIALTQETVVPVTGDGSYLVTGGTRGLGLAVAEWLVEQGARNLLLIARRQPAADALARIAQMEAAGVHVEVAIADVADAAALEQALAGSRGGIAALRGVVHAAGVLRDGMLASQEWDEFHQVLAPKVEGAWNLHRLTQAAPLDFFVLFSSIASLLGGAGQGNHAAANAFEDALALARRAAGQPAISINWGSWSDIGSAARPDLAKRRAEIGLEDFTPDEGLALFERILVAAPAQIAAARIDWQTFAARWPTGARPAWLPTASGDQRSARATAAEPRSGGGAKAVSLRDELAPLTGEHRQRVLDEHLQKLAARVLATDQRRRIDPRQPLHELGLDSLMAVEFRNALAALIGEHLPATLLFSYPALEDLARYLLTRLVPAEAEDTEIAGESPTTDVIGAIDNLSDEEVDRLLAEGFGGAA